jgi:hypothetical protein
LIRNSAAAARVNAIKARIGNESVGTVGGGTPGPSVCVGEGRTDVEVGVAVAVGVDVEVGVGVAVGVGVDVDVEVAVAVGVGVTVVIRPILLPITSVNQRLPSGPDPMPTGTLLAVGI